MNIDSGTLLAEVQKWGLLRTSRLRELVRQDELWLKTFGAVDDEGDHGLTEEHLQSLHLCERELRHAERVLAAVNDLATVEDESIRGTFEQCVLGAQESKRIREAANA